ncbi:copper transport protein ATOX1 [Aethina tumida]|uniref:copper transport protein ATOX1 n=1 Tax=Aethina tumida TaxID=116153 RepID=UPI00096B46B7|nr:copper transport protein ATOX1 [Aethina tumida]
MSNTYFPYQNLIEFCSKFIPYVNYIKMSAKVHTFKVTMTCEGCSNQIDKVLGKLKGNGVEEVNISLPDQEVKVTTTLTSDEILEIIKKTGKKVEYLNTA